MTCHRMGRYPMLTSGLGIVSENSLSRIPRPPQNKTTFIDVSSPARSPDQYDLTSGRIRSSVTSALRGRRRQPRTAAATSAGCIKSSGRYGRPSAACTGFLHRARGAPEVDAQDPDAGGIDLLAKAVGEPPEGVLGGRVGSDLRPRRRARPSSSRTRSGRAGACAIPAGAAGSGGRGRGRSSRSGGPSAPPASARARRGRSARRCARGCPPRRSPARSRRRRARPRARRSGRLDSTAPPALARSSATRAKGVGVAADEAQPDALSRRGRARWPGRRRCWRP